MHKRRRIYEAREKIIFEGAEAGTYIQFFKDELLENKAGEESSSQSPSALALSGKAVLHNRISEYIFTRLHEIGIPTYFIKSLNMREQLVHTVEMIPIILVCRNNVSPALARRLGLEAGTPLLRPLLEFYYADEKLGNPLISEEHILTFDWANEQDLEDMIALTTRINDFLCGLFAASGLRPADIHLKFGRLWSGDAMQLVLSNEISPDSCSLWKKENLTEKPSSADKNIDKIPAAQQSEENSAGKLTNADKENEKFYPVSHREAARRLGLLK